MLICFGAAWPFSIYKSLKSKSTAGKSLIFLIVVEVGYIAGIIHKARHIAITGIKGLIMINFIGVMVGAMKGGSEFVLAMTGGGPFTPYGQTEVVGLHIYYQAFMYLRFGAATAMAWVLGSMLVGFTVFQLKRLSRMEFKTAAGVA